MIRTSGFATRYTTMTHNLSTEHLNELIDSVSEYYQLGNYFIKIFIWLMITSKNPKYTIYGHVIRIPYNFEPILIDTFSKR